MHESVEVAMAALAPLLDRQSVKVFSHIGPTDVELEAILRAAVTVPDHGGLRPWRLVVIAGDARAAFGDALADAGAQVHPDQTVEQRERLRAKAFLAPALIAVVARVDPAAKVAAWEQVASAACAGYAIALAADRLGLGAIWKSSRFRDGAVLRRVLDMGLDDEFLGWVNIGRTPIERSAMPRPAIDLDDIVRVLTPAGEPVSWRSPAPSASAQTAR